MIRFSLLSSGSSGNATLVASHGVKILVDNGLTFRQLNLRAAEVGESLDDLTAVVVTHEHGDHVNGLRVLSRKLGVPIFMTPGTYENLPVRLRDIEGVNLFEAGDTLRFNGVQLNSFSISHDAADPVSYVVDSNGVRLGMASDVGHVSNLVRQRLMGCNGLVLESNYCPEMLLHSAYPPAIRQRIDSRFGHLSNADACSLLKTMIHDALSLVVLMHISEQNNTPERVRDMVSMVMRGHPAKIHLAEQNAPTPMFELAV